MIQGNFTRQYLMKAGIMGRNGFQIGQESGSGQRALHISFSIEKSASEAANTAKVQIWNLSDASLRVLDTKDCAIELQAGYEGHIALVLVGNVVTVTTQMDGADRLTELEVVDGRVAIRDTYMSVSFSGKVNSRDLFDYVAGAMGVPVVYSKGCVFKVLPNGFSFIGAGKNALKKLCGACGLTWSIQNSILQVRKPNEPITSTAYLLSADTGLLGIPKRITLSAEGDDAGGIAGSSAARVGYEVRYLLNGAVGVNDYIRLESGVARGYFRVCRLTMDGDNFEGEWSCTAQLLEVG